MKKVLLLLIALGLLFACAEKKVATMQEEEMEQPQETTVSEEPITPVQEEPVQVSKPMEMEAPAQTAADVLSSDVHFDFDRYDIKADDKANLKKIADWLIANGGVNVVVEGHCDERGTNEYNLGLGERRSNAVKSYLMTLGVSSSRVKTVSYGEERPLCSQSSEGCWWKNRRAHFEVAK